ncbi:MAG: anthranilate phosphoribosyltransferase [Acidobacteriota bacterium]
MTIELPSPPESLALLAPLAPGAALRRVMAGEDLSRAEMESLFGQLMDGKLSDAMKAALLVALAMKSECAAEIAGAASAMRQRVVRIPHRQESIVDTCGTGGDGKGTFNISTAAALVAAAAGAKVAKHGNRSVSSRSGSADVLAALGVDIEATPERAGQALDEIGIAFLFAPRLHPAMREVMPVRRELGVRTVFNVLGPLTNPAGARRQVMGVYSESLVEIVGEVLAQLGSEHALVVHGSDGLDEITLTGPTRVAEVRHGRVEVRTVRPEDFGVPAVPLEKLLGGDPEHNAGQLRAVLDGEAGPLSDVTAVNAGAALYAAGLAANLLEGFERSRQAIASGAAAAKLEQLRAFRR